MKIQRDGNGVALPAFDQPIEQIHIKGLLPEIINVTPFINLPLLLGFRTEVPPSDPSEKGPLSSYIQRDALIVRKIAVEK